MEGKKPIEIKPQNRGLFTEKAKRKGLSVQAYATMVLANKDADEKLRKEAQFAHNFRGKK